MKSKRPLLVTFIGDLLFITAFFGLLSFLPTPSFLEQFGFSFIPIHNFYDFIIRLLEVIILFTISYGFFKVKRWGYYSMICYNLFLLSLSILLTVTHTKISEGSLAYNFIPSLLLLFLTYPSKRYFLGES